MKTYEETARTVLGRVEEYNVKKSRRNRALKPVAALVCCSALAAALIFGIKAFNPPVPAVPEESGETSVEVPSVKKLSASIAELSDGVLASGFKVDYQTWSYDNRHISDKNAPKTASVTVDGVEYTGEYVESSVLKLGIYSSDVSHKYSQKNVNGYDISFWLRSTDGKLIKFEAHKALSEHGAVDEEKCRAAAERIAKAYLGDKLDEYQIEAVTDGTYYYQYLVYKLIDGYKAAWTLNVVVNREGALVILMVGDTFDGIDSLPFSKEKADAVVAGKVAEITKDLKNYKDFSYDYVRPVALSDGSIGAVYGVLINTSFNYYDEVTQTVQTGDASDLIEILVYFSN